MWATEQISKIGHCIVCARQERMQVGNPASMQWTPVTGTTVCALP